MAIVDTQMEAARIVKERILKRFPNAIVAFRVEYIDGKYCVAGYVEKKEIDYEPFVPLATNSGGFEHNPRNAHKAPGFVSIY